MPEIGGDAVLYFDPHDKEDIKKVIKDALFDKSLREQLVARGRERLKLYSWERCAQETLAVFEKA
jgi:glycosyltransferase involved in cell wall biosynthesis